MTLYSYEISKLIIHNIHNEINLIFMKAHFFHYFLNETPLHMVVGLAHIELNSYKILLLLEGGGGVGISALVGVGS